MSYARDVVSGYEKKRCNECFSKEELVPELDTPAEGMMTVSFASLFLFLFRPFSISSDCTMSDGEKGVRFYFSCSFRFYQRLPTLVTT
jgi:hypothetical protein